MGARDTAPSCGCGKTASLKQCAHISGYLVKAVPVATRNQVVAMAGFGTLAPCQTWPETQTTWMHQGHGHPCNTNSDACNGRETHRCSNNENNKAHQQPPEAQAVTKRAHLTPLAEKLECGNCWLSKISRIDSCKRNQKLVLYLHLLEN